MITFYILDIKEKQLGYGKISRYMYTDQSHLFFTTQNIVIKNSKSLIFVLLVLNMVPRNSICSLNIYRIPE